MQIAFPLRTQSLQQSLYSRAPACPFLDQSLGMWSLWHQTPSISSGMAGGKSSPSSRGGTREAWGELLGILHLRGPWKGQRQSSSPSPGWMADHHVLREEAYRVRQIHVVPTLAIWFLKQLLLAEEVQTCAHLRLLNLCFLLTASQSMLFSAVSSSFFRVTLHNLTPLFADFSYSSTARQGRSIIKNA